MRGFSLGLMFLVAVACSSSPTADGGTGGATSTGGGGGGGGSTSTGGGASAGGGSGGGHADGGNVDAGPVFSMMVVVPPDGGSITVMGSQQFTIVFPADVAGQSFTVERIPATTYGFAPGYFTDLFRFGPNGTQLTTPLQVIPADPSTSVGFAFLYSEPVTPAGAELSWFLDGGYPIAHFSSFGVIGSKAAVCDGATFGTSALQTTGTCYKYKVDSNGIENGGSEQVPGDTTILDSCGIGETCMLYSVANCISSTSADAILGDPRHIWTPPGTLPLGYAAMGYNSLGLGKCAAVNTPADCTSLDVSGIDPTGCTFGATCSGNEVTLKCGGGMCSCTGGSANMTFAQGTTCSGAIKALTTLYTQCM